MTMMLPLIYNPAAGSFNERRLQKIARELANHGAHVELLPTTGPGSATILAREAAAAGAARIAVAGGDGTINEVINGLKPGETELAIIPSGTANVLALELGIPFKTGAACRIAVQATARAMDLGRAGERYFALMAGVGFDAMAIKNVNPALKKAIRHAAFPISGVKTMVREDLPMLEIDAAHAQIMDGHQDGGLSESGFFAVISNSRYYGGRFGPNPGASICDGLLDVCVLKDNSFGKMLRFWLHALTSSRLSRGGAVYFRTTELEVSCPHGNRVPVQTDGEIAGELPVTFSVVPAGLRICRGAL